MINTRPVGNFHLTRKMNLNRIYVDTLIPLLSFVQLYEYFFLS